MAGDQPTTPAPVSEPRVFFVNKRDPGTDPLGLIVHKQTGSLVQSSAREVEDEFRGVNEIRATNQVLHPTFDFRALTAIAWQNSIVPPLIEAMEVNIDGTGWEIVALEDEEIQDPAERAENEQRERTREVERQRQRQAAFESGEPFVDIEEDPQVLQDRIQTEREKMGIEAFFDEPFPGVSFLTMRRAVRQDLEQFGNGYLEVIRNIRDEVMMVRWLDGKTIRLVRLDEPVSVKRTLVRAGQDVEVDVELRERRFVQAIGGKFIFFKAFGASRDLNRFTGEWALPGERLSPTDRATELIHFINKKDPESPYGLPRWISNAPSVTGSRKAEEFNLDFFDAGGIPPLLLIVQGGRIAENAEQALRSHFLATGVARHQAAILEAFSTSGDIDSPQNVRVTVERFGSDRQKDSMFELYIKNCDIRTQRAFRLPSLFLGMSEDMNFATAFASYTVAEAQVFRPERQEFDEVINLQLLPQLPNGDKFEFRSLPVVAADSARQVDLLSIAKDMVAPAEMVEEINQIGNMSLKVKETLDEPILRPDPPVEQPGSRGDVEGGGEEPAGQQAGGEPDSTPPGSRPQTVRQVEKTELRGLRVLAEDVAWQMQRGFRDGKEITKFQERMTEVRTLHPSQSETFKAFLAHELFPDKQADPEGACALAESLLRQFDSRYGE